MTGITMNTHVVWAHDTHTGNRHQTWLEGDYALCVEYARQANKSAQYALSGVQFSVRKH